METNDIFAKEPGDGTDKAARILAKYLEGRPFSVLSDHGSKSDEYKTIGHIVSWYFSKEDWKTPLSQIDIVVLDQSSPRRALALIEIEETNDRPKNLLGDILSILVGNDIRFRGESFDVGIWTTLIVIAKGPDRHDHRNTYLSSSANNIRSFLNTDDNKIGEIVIKTFDDEDLTLETVLRDEVDRALERAKTFSNA